MLVAALGALAVIGCRSRAREAPAAAPGSASGSSPAAASASSSAVGPSPATAADGAPGPALPGTLYVKPARGLARLAGGRWTTAFADVGAEVFPSAYALPDGRVVGIASRGDGEPGGEQLVVIAGDGAIARVGPAATAVREPAVDRAGAWIVVEAKLEPRSELYRVEVASGEATRLTDDPQGNFTPATLGPSAIAFASSRDGDSELYRLELATRRATRLTAFHRDDWAPRPSPDGKTIAFLSDREGPPHVFLVDADGAHLRRLTAGAEGEDEPAWSPDGTAIAFTRAGKLVVRVVASGAERAFTPADARDAEPAWSPDGAWIAVTRARARASTVVAIPLAGGEAVAVMAGARLPRWHR